MDNPVMFFTTILGVLATLAGLAGAGVIWYAVGGVLLFVALIVGGVLRERTMR